MEQPAHHLMAAGPSEKDLQAAALVAAWRLRKASGFVARDPLDVRTWRSSRTRLANKRKYARLWLEFRGIRNYFDCIKGPACKPAARLTVIRGGRA